jgi:2-iminobutanoate/2-iminopropanoate deaminase
MDRVFYPTTLPIPASRAVRAGDFVFVSGQMPFGPDGLLVHGPIEVQARVVLEAIKRTLEEAGCSMADVVKNTVWLQDPRDFTGYNKVYAEYFPKDPPARATVQAELMVEARIEIESLAYRPLKRSRS